MNKKTFYPLLSALACVGAMAFAPAQAGQVECKDSQMAALSSSCIGPFKQSGDVLDEVAVFGTGYALAGGSKSGDLFINAPIDREGTLTFDWPLDGPFVLGFRAGAMYSFYLFDGEDSKSIDFDTDGVVKRGSSDSGVLNEVYLFTVGGLLPEAPVHAGEPSNETALAIPPAAQQVPEPASGALAVLALAAAGFAARRRRD